MWKEVTPQYMGPFVKVAHSLWGEPIWMVVIRLKHSDDTTEWSFSSRQDALNAVKMARLMLRRGMPATANYKVMRNTK